MSDDHCYFLTMNKKLLDLIIRDYYHVYFRLKTLADERKVINKQSMHDVTDIVHRVKDRKQTIRTASNEFMLKKTKTQEIARSNSIIMRKFNPPPPIDVSL